MSRKYQLRIDHHDSRDLVFAPSFITLPKKVDLRPQMPPIFDQGQLGSCGPNAFCGLDQFYMQQRGDKTQLSRLYVYYKVRELEGSVNEDSGVMLRDLMKVGTKFGAAPEADFPYDIHNFTHKPTTQAEADAVKYKLTSYKRINTLSDVKSSLAQGHPVVFGMVLYTSYESEAVARTGKVPMPNTITEQKLGGHAQLIVGFDDDLQVVIVRNSWGSGWADKGYCYIPYAMFTGRKFITDMWTAA